MIQYKKMWVHIVFFCCSCCLPWQLCDMLKTIEIASTLLLDVLRLRKIPNLACGQPNIPVISECLPWLKTNVLCGLQGFPDPPEKPHILQWYFDIFKFAKSEHLVLGFEIPNPFGFLEVIALHAQDRSGASVFDSLPNSECRCPMVWWENNLEMVHRVTGFHLPRVNLFQVIHNLTGKMFWIY